jgi:hypothetical protein
VDWFDIAEALADETKSVRHGDRGAAVAKWGQARGLKPQTLRTYALARGFLLRLRAEAPALAERLQGAPAIAVEALARWHRRDPLAALAAGERLADGAMTVRHLAAAERASRSPSQGQGKAILIKSLIAGPSGRDFRLPEAEVRRLKVDLLYRDCPVMIVGPYSVVTQYGYLATDWVLKAVGLAQIYGQSALLVPQAGREEFLRGVGSLSDKASISVQFLTVRPDGGVVER